MKKTNKTTTFAYNVGLTILGGMGLFIATAILNSMFSAPVSRADFDKHKAEYNGHIRNIDDKLGTLKEGQQVLLNHILKDGKK